MTGVDGGRGKKCKFRDHHGYLGWFLDFYAAVPAHKIIISYITLFTKLLVTGFNGFGIVLLLYRYFEPTVYNELYLSSEIDQKTPRHNMK